MPTACWRRSNTGRRRKAATRPRSSSTCSGKRSRAPQRRGTAREVRREDADSSAQRGGDRRDDARDVLARVDARSVRHRRGVGGRVENDDDEEEDSEEEIDIDEDADTDTDALLGHELACG